MDFPHRFIVVGTAGLEEGNTTAQSGSVRRQHDDLALAATAHAKVRTSDDRRLQQTAERDPLSGASVMRDPRRRANQPSSFREENGILLRFLSGYPIGFSGYFPGF